MSALSRPPLVELHIHLEGCLTAARAQALWSERPSIEPPLVGVLQDGSWRFRDLGEFLQLFAWAARLLDSPAAYRQLLQDTAAFLEAQGIVYAELFVAFGVMHHFDRDPKEIVPELADWAKAHAREGGVDLRFIADGVRQFGPRAAARVLEDAIALREQRVVGLGIGGDENSLPASAFAELYARAREAGLGTTLHAGEGTSARAVAEAMELGVSRIGHGIAAAEDPGVMRELVKRGVVLEVCPGSNLRSGAWTRGRASHPLKRLAEAGVRVCLGSDDPSFFQTSLKDEWEECLAHGFSHSKLREWNEGAAAAAFLPEDERRRLLHRVQKKS
ncbi:MAG TPA: adenosine deaminase [Candidatus Krumholzibacteria bacterium]|nr:adenosine deaminase [Candidatus Krumholzibacteria bacterium]